MRYEIKELNVGGILDQAITLVKNHFALLFNITLWLMIPFGVIVALITTLGGPTETVPGVAPNPTALLVGALLNIINGLLVVPLTNAAILHALAGEYLEKPTTVGQAFTRAFQVFLPYLGTAMLTGLVIFAGYILLIIPGILFSFWYCLSTQIVVIEGKSGSAALKRSHQLIKGNIGTAFVLGALIVVIQIGLAVATTLVPRGIVAGVVSTLVQAVLFLFLSAAWVVFYFSCRCKHENFDLTILAESVGREEPGAPQVEPAG